ncbi:MAG TPA: dynamin family protein [Acidimicrobiales bacterium]|nr:dynamin family protein [Acidimicrobiales bacterium]
MAPDNMAERVAELISAHRRCAPEPLDSELSALEARLGEPVRVAVVGRVKAGKSTVVNALLGQAVAPTDVSECTKLVNWFRYGQPQRVVVDLEGGGSREVQLTPAGRLPSELGTSGTPAIAVNAYLANDTLRSMTLIDTPGLGSVHEGLSMSTRELLAASRDTSAAAAKADAVVLLMSQVVMEDEIEALALFRASDPRRQRASAGNVLGVLSRADQLGDGNDDPWKLAVDLAANYAERLRAELATVVPVMGLLAETAESAALTEPDARDLAALAAMEPERFERLLWSGDRFVSGDAPVASESRQRLLELLDLYGLRRAVELIRDGKRGAVALRKELSQLSGIANLKRTLIAQFRERDHLLKVRSALEQLHELSFAQADDETDAERLRALRTDVEALRLSPAMHRIAEMEASYECAAGLVPLPAPLLEEAARLFGSGTLAERMGVDPADTEALARFAEEGMARWRCLLATTTSPVAGRVARTAHRTYQLAWGRAS